MRPHKTLARVCAAAACLAAAQVQAQGISLHAGDEMMDRVEHPRGVYTGVKPGGDEAPGLGVEPGTTPAAITWPGFQMRPDGSSRVFVQLTTQVDVRTVVQGNKILIDFGNAIIAGETNRYPLYTSYFNTPVTSVELKRTNKRTIMELTLRAAVEPSVSSEHAKSGYYFVYFDFAAGNYRSDAPPVPADAAASPPAPASTPAPAAIKAPPSHLDGSVRVGAQAQTGANANASGSANAAADAELPPGMGKLDVKAKGKTEAKVKIGL